ncbi:MAG: mechanosensitive ion channel family protein, partial [Planctomycetaceae bacterium]|nr:mechanosensitive ion channel family protein [Planctomycetaceae bacterium]
MLLLRILSIVVFCFGLELSSVAQENTPPQSPAAAQPTTATPEGAQAATPAKTVGNTGIEISRLKILTRPMTATELEVEVKAWAEKLRNQIKAVGDVEMKIKSAPAEASSKDLKTQLLELRSEELEIVKRTQLLIKECTSKGGDAQSEKTYVEAVSKLNETPDAASYWVAVTATLQSWLFAEDGGLKLLKNIGVAIVIMFFFWIISKFAGGVIGRVLSKHGRTSMLLINFVRRTIGGVVLLVGAAMALAALGVQVGPMVAALGAGGFIIGFALQETLGSFASGMMIMVYRPFDVDDFVKVAGETGTVKEMSLVSTKLLTPDNKVLVIPNKKAWGDTITNFTGCGVRRVDLVFGIGYEDDIQRAIDVLKEVAGQHPNVLSEPGLTVNVHELADSSV